MSQRNAFSTLAGYRDSRAVSTGWVVIYDAAESGIDVGGDRYAVVCEAHGVIVGERAMVRARLSMRASENFCGECRTEKGISDE